MQRFVLVLCALLVAADAEAFCRLTTAEPSAGGACSTSGRGLSWQRQCISYTVVPREKEGIDLDAIRDTIDDSFEPWIRVSCGDAPLPIELGQTQALGGCSEAEYNQYGPNANTIMFLSEWEGEDFPREAFGLTLVWHDPQTGEIFDADMQLNETIAPIAICDGGCSGDVVDLSNVVTHEAGHFLGLGHTNVLSATMSANALLGETSKRSLEQDDMDGVCSIYASNTAPVCDEADFAPDRGFSPHCGADEPEDTSCSARAVGSEHEPRAPLPLASAALALLWLYRRRRSSATARVDLER
jgi:MYXO-CTERM domain-containing protein